MPISRTQLGRLCQDFLHLLRSNRWPLTTRYRQHRRERQRYFEPLQHSQYPSYQPSQTCLPSAMSEKNAPDQSMARKT
jgi:hypothetical protein